MKTLGPPKKKQKHIVMSPCPPSVDPTFDSWHSIHNHLMGPEDPQPNYEDTNKKTRDFECYASQPFVFSGYHGR